MHNLFFFKIIHHFVLLCPIKKETKKNNLNKLNFVAVMSQKS